MRSKRKKGSIFLTVAIPFIFLVVMLIAFNAFNAKHKAISDNRKLGELQFGLLGVVQKPENSLVYVDKAGEYSAIQAAYELARNGGFFEAKCGEIEPGVYYWIEKGKEKNECFPEYEKSYNSHIKNYLSGYVNIYNSTLEKEEDKNLVTIPGNNYELLSVPEGEKLNVYGFADRNLDYEKMGYIYSIKPSFFTQVDYYIDEYESLIDTVKSVVNKCHTIDDEDELKVCVNEELDLNRINALYKGNRTFIVEYDSEKLLFEKDKIKIKFAFYIMSNDVPILKKPFISPEGLQEVIDSIVEISSKDKKINPNLIKAVMDKETNRNINQINADDSKEIQWKSKVNSLDCIKYGCNNLIDVNGDLKHKIACRYGLMNLEYDIALDRCDDIITDADSMIEVDKNIECGARIIENYLEECGSIEGAVYRYHHGNEICPTEDVKDDLFVKSVMEKCEELGGCESEA
ncbi:MAG: hypothetical protein V1740_03055 [Candidatus Woesearchaeota archaeon]